MLITAKYGTRKHVRQVLAAFVIFCAAGSAFGQSSERELKLLLLNSPAQKHDSIYYELFKVYRTNDLFKAKTYASQAYKAAKKSNHPEMISKSCRALAYTHDKSNDLDSAKFYYYEGIKYCKISKDSKLLVYLYNSCGILFERLDIYDSALHYYNLSLEAATNVGSIEDQAIAYNNIGLVFYYLNNYEDALNNLSASVDIKRKYDLASDLPPSLMNIALIYNDQGKYDQALQLLNEVKEMCNIGSGCDDKILTELNFDMGWAYFAKNDLSEAYGYLVKGYEFARKTNNKKVIAQTMYYFAQFKLENKNFNGALSDLREAESLAQEINSKRLKRDIYDAYRKVYMGMNNLEKVVVYQNKYMAIKDSIFNETLATSLKDIQLDAQRKQQEQIIQNYDTQLERSRLIIGLVGIILVLTLIVSILIYRSFRFNQRMKVLLEKEIKRRTAELEKSNSDLKRMAQEYDQLVYRASHDIRGPLATLLGLTNVAKQDFNEPDRVRDYLNKIGSTAQGLSQTLSQLMETNRIRNLPICLEEVDLLSLVEESYNSFNTLNHFPLISLRIEKGDWREPLITDRNLVGFILGKLLDNAFKYFSASKDNKYIKISWSQDQQETTIAVEDNGMGIDPNAREKIFQLFYVANDVHGTGLGLFLAQLAANRLGGRIVLARSSNPTIFKLVISSNIADQQVEEVPLMTVAK